jgi:hypothetical protein
MGSLPKEEAGVGSATSDTSMQIGGALGVGVLGTALAFRYRNLIAPLLAHQQLPAGINQLILGSLGGALAVAQRAPGNAGEALADAARRAFISGMDLALIIAAVIVGVAGAVVLIALPSRPMPQTGSEPGPAIARGEELADKVSPPNRSGPRPTDRRGAGSATP